MTEIRKWIPLFGLACLVIELARGDEVLITTPHVTSSSEGKCNFPDVLSVELTLPGSDEGWTIPLKKDSIFQTRSDVEAYHNHHHGASFIAKCVRQGTETRYLLLEGSVFINSNKFRITPSPSWSLNLQVFPSHVTANYNMTYIEEFHARDAKAVLASSSAYLEMTATRRQTGERNKRAATLPVTYYLDILVVVDSFFYNIFYNRSGRDPDKTVKNINDYLGVLFSHVAMRQDTLQLEKRTLKIRLFPPIVQKSISEAPYTNSDLKSANKTSIDAKTLLDLFMKWLVKTPNLGAYDHAMFITGLQIEGGTDSGIKFNVTQGLAYIGTICQMSNSSSIISDKGAYQSEGVAAHEITHSLGSDHDGIKNNCSSADRYIMSDGSYLETVGNKLNPWKYSACSSQSVLGVLKDLEKNPTILQTCLKGSNGSDINVNTSTISATDQCRLNFGNGSSVCRGGTVPPLDNICDEFFCRLPGTSTCNRFIAATGTCCDKKKKCSQGQCVDAKADECPWGECPFEDQDGIVEFISSLTCEQLPTIHCYNDTVNLKCCNFCKKVKTSIPGCPYGDKKLGCKPWGCEMVANSSYNFDCCKTCENPCTDAESLNISGQAVSCKDYIGDMKNQFRCYNAEIRKYCCESCEKARNATNTACPWKERSDCSVLNSKSRPYKCTANELLICCHTCSTLGGMTTTTSKISTTSAPASAPATTSTSTKRAITNSNPTTQAAPSAGVTQRKIAPCRKVLKCGAATNVISLSVLGFLGAVYICLVKWLFW